LLWFIFGYPRLFYLKFFFFNHLIPAGTPFFINPLIIVIEIISHLSRIISLSVRLFANMTSGHTLLKIFSNFAVASLLNSSFFIKSFFIISFFIVLLVTNLEILISGLQGYVYLFLICFYTAEYNLNDH